MLGFTQTFVERLGPLKWHTKVDEWHTLNDIIQKVVIRKGLKVAYNKDV